MLFLKFVTFVTFLATLSSFMVNCAVYPRKAEIEFEDVSNYWEPIGRFEDEALKNYLEDRKLKKIPERIIGGSEAEDGAAPFVAQLRRQGRKGDTFKFICGGSLITPRTILSAAHCVIR